LYVFSFRVDSIQFATKNQTPLTQNFSDINPNATDAQVLRIGHYAVGGFAIFVAAFATMLHGVNIDLGFIYVSFPMTNLNNRNRRILTIYLHRISLASSQAQHFPRLLAPFSHHDKEL
jgi:hypothetical protein